MNERELIETLLPNLIDEEKMMKMRFLFFYAYTSF